MASASSSEPASCNLLWLIKRSIKMRFTLSLKSPSPLRDLSGKKGIYIELTPGGIDAPVKLYFKHPENEISVNSDMKINLCKSVLIKFSVKSSFAYS